MIKKILFVWLIGLFVSCEKPKKTYYYVEKVNEEMLNGTFEIKYKKDTIYYENDSLAYIRAFQKFCISQKLDKDYKEKNYKHYTTTLGFSLLNAKGEDITHSNIMLDRSKIEKEIMEDINNEKNSFDIDDIVSTDYESTETGSYDQDESGMAAQIAQEYVKARLNNPSTADFQWASISHKRIDASTYQVMQKFTAKNSFNVETEYLYKIHLKYKGGISADSNNWEETYFKMEEYGK